MHYFSEVRKKNMSELENKIKKIENSPDYEKKLNTIILNFAIDKGLREKTAWRYYNQLRTAGKVK